MHSVEMAVPTTTTREGERSRGDLANTLAVSGLMAIFLAYLLMFSVLGGAEYASKFENGELPAGFDAKGGQTAAVMSLGIAVFCFVAIAAAACIRGSKLVGVTAVLGLLAAVPYAPLELLTWQLAF
jgi:putative copper export protein